MSARGAARSDLREQKHDYVLRIPKRLLGLVEQGFPSDVSILVTPPGGIQPEFIRLHWGTNEDGSAHVCPITGLPMGTLMEVLKKAGRKVKTVYLRKDGARRGITLVHRQSLVNYLMTQPPNPDCAHEGQFQLEAEVTG